MYKYTYLLTYLLTYHVNKIVFNVRQVTTADSRFTQFDRQWVPDQQRGVDGRLCFVDTAEQSDGAGWLNVDVGWRSRRPECSDRPECSKCQTPVHGHRLQTCCTASTTCFELVRWLCPLVVYNMSVAGVRVVEFGTTKLCVMLVVCLGQRHNVNWLYALGSREHAAQSRRWNSDDDLWWFLWRVGVSGWECRDQRQSATRVVTSQQYAFRWQQHTDCFN